jgi:hypothetical protein
MYIVKVIIINKIKMDFVYGIISIIMIIFILINFASINLSNKSIVDSQQIQQAQNQNYLIAPNYINPMPNAPNAPNATPNVPQPIVANSQLALNKKMNLEVQTYDYHKYFYFPN